MNCFIAHPPAIKSVGLATVGFQHPRKFLESGERPVKLARRVSPLQGGGDWFGPSSQGVALGWRVVAPLARNIGMS
jgi:hypothetical protein